MAARFDFLAGCRATDLIKQANASAQCSKLVKLIEPAASLLHPVNTPLHGEYNRILRCRKCSLESVWMLPYFAIVISATRSGCKKLLCHVAIAIIVKFVYISYYCMQ